MDNTMTNVGKELEDRITLYINDDDGKPVPTIIIDMKGFYYRGELVEDAGKAYLLFLEWLQKAHRSIV